MYHNSSFWIYKIIHNIVCIFKYDTFDIIFMFCPLTYHHLHERITLFELHAWPSGHWVNFSPQRNYISWLRRWKSFDNLSFPSITQIEKKTILFVTNFDSSLLLSIFMLRFWSLKGKRCNKLLLCYYIEVAVHLAEVEMSKYNKVITNVLIKVLLRTIMPQL